MYLKNISAKYTTEKYIYRRIKVTIADIERICIFLIIVIHIYKMSVLVIEDIYNILF